MSEESNIYEDITGEILKEQPTVCIKDSGFKTNQVIRRTLGVIF